MMVLLLLIGNIQEKKLKNRNLERAKELGKEYVGKKTGVRL